MADFSNMAPGGLIPQLGAKAAIPDDLDWSQPPGEEMPMEEGDVPSYMKDPEPSEVDKELNEEPKPLTGKAKAKAKWANDDREWVPTHWCEVCNVGLSSQRQLDLHLNGKNHEKKMKLIGENSETYVNFLEERKTNPDAESPWRCDVCVINFVDPNQYQIHLKGKPHERKLRVKAGNSKTIDYICDMCGINTGSNRIVYDAHLDGKNHAKRLGQGKLTEQQLADPGESAYFCEICKINMTNACQYIAHLGGSQHTRRVAAIEAGEEVNDMPDNSGLLSAASGGGKNMFWCDICKLKLTGQQPFQDHMNGKKHRDKAAAVASGVPPGAQMAQPKQPKQPKAPKRPFQGVPYIPGQQQPMVQSAKMPRTGPREPTINKKCDICNVILVTQKTYDAHMSGQLHLKKAKMIEAMGGKMTLPEGSLAKKIIDDGPQIKDGQIYCILCDMSFSTVQVALDHFPGRKHKSKMRVQEISFERYGPFSESAKRAESLIAAAQAAATNGKDAYGNFVSGGTVKTVGVPDVGLDKADIDAKIAEANKDFIGPVDPSTNNAPLEMSTTKSNIPYITGKSNGASTEANAAEVPMDTASKLLKLSGTAASDKEETPEVNAEAMDTLVQEVSPLDSNAIVCTICSIGVSSIQMLQNHVVGAKHIRKVMAVAVGDGSKLEGMRGRGTPINRGRGFFRGRGRGRGRGGAPSTGFLMSKDNDGTTHDYQPKTHRPPMGYKRGMTRPPGAQFAGSNIGYTTGPSSYKPGSGGWNTWTGSTSFH